MFTKAIKRDAKLRLALCGPAGSGKTYSLLTLATELGGPIAYVDTEHGSASKYADLFDFDVIEPNTFDPRDLIDLINGAAANGYKTICIDSLSHYWMGKGGELELIDNTAKRSPSNNSFNAWKTVTPIHNELIDTIIAAPLHVMVSMRTKTEWVIEKNEKGKNEPRKIGLAPIMRDGIEFEFDVCGDLDQENTLVVTKSRCPELVGKAINRPGKAMAQTLKKWLNGTPIAPKITHPEGTVPHDGEKPVFRSDDTDLPSELGGPVVVEAKSAVPERIAQAKERLEGPKKPWATYKQMLQCFADKLESIGETESKATLELFGVSDPSEFRNRPELAFPCFLALEEVEGKLRGAVAQ